MDKSSLLHIASREKSSRRYDQRQADLRNIAVLAAFGKHDTRFYDTSNVCDEANEKFWTKMIKDISGMKITSAKDYPPFTVYEYTSFVLSRATQLSMGAQSFFAGNKKDLVEIARHEIRSGTADAVIRRRNANGENVYIRVTDACGQTQPVLKYFGNNFLRDVNSNLPITSSVL